MNYYIQQTIQIHFLKVQGISNSSVLQIGSAGVIKPNSHLYNTGGFTGPAPEAKPPGGGSVTQAPAVPLQSTSG